MNLIQTSAEYRSAFSASADAQGGYGGFTGSASAKSETLTSKTSLYFMFYEKELGSIHLNSDAKLTQAASDLLMKDPAKFATLYGKYFIQGATLGCQATATVTITAKSESGKKSLDVIAKASFTVPQHHLNPK